MSISSKVIPTPFSWLWVLYFCGFSFIIALLDIKQFLLFSIITITHDHDYDYDALLDCIYKMSVWILGDYRVKC
ncbi:hypothetical protein P175DRAFT_0269561 [Aspergillus ochraceoroseus IBT 24754]|uniref:Uncharacterized protein n=1 Tax=Aspergillus ochraceoroseus IBT 24754 TaxID=1392256 RepID=A0A2T5LUZ2_9EURO|nr:uncharacterized protein P175DRAFT_0269561 [Aspergillus ochraceoroseus IBT 24754]PTU20105.1 hypothetical protein P175DRAFT_0269561 [Aspergillus ochraceoroseus IBT 24754]